MGYNSTCTYHNRAQFWILACLLTKTKHIKNAKMFLVSKPILPWVSALKKKKAVTHDVLLSCDHSISKLLEQQWPFYLPSPSCDSVGQTLKTSSSVVLLTRNWAMSKAKSWTKLNRCSANDATRPKLDFWSSGSPGTSLLSAHKVTDTTSQQSWAARWQSIKEESQGGENRGEDGNNPVMTVL